MALDNSMKGSTEGPYLQFDECTYDEECKYRNNTGRCIYETCVVLNELPPATETWYFKCKVCDDIDVIRPNKMKIQICRSCLERMLAAEKKPFSCVFCGSSQNHNSKIFLSGICDTCFSKINNAINCSRCGN